MIDDAERFIGWLLRPYASSVDYDDIRQEARLALWAAEERYDPDRGIKFTTFATFWIRGAVRHYMRDKRSLIHFPAARYANGERGPHVSASLDNPDFDWEYEPLLGEQIIPSVEALEYARKLGMLSPIEEFVIRKYHGDGYTLTEIAGFLGCSQTNCSKIRARAIEKLRAMMEDELDDRKGADSDLYEARR